jgi:ketosteroid isomerase-like protein
MKFIITLFTIAALSWISSSRGQEESPASSPAAEESTAPQVEAPSTSRDASPSPSPEAKSSPSATPAEKKEKAAATASSPAESKKEEGAKTSAKKTASTADTGSSESNVKRLENEWEGAVMKKDPSFIQSRVAEDFIGTSSKGKRMNKAGLLKEFKNDTDTYTSAKNGSVTVRSFGSNIAVATGTAKEVGKTKDGKAFSRTYAWTDTWMLRGNQWQCVASQAMLVSGK